MIFVPLFKRFVFSKCTWQLQRVLMNLDWKMYFLFRKIQVINIFTCSIISFIHFLTFVVNSLWIWFSILIPCWFIFFKFSSTFDLWVLGKPLFCSKLVDPWKDFGGSIWVEGTFKSVTVIITKYFYRNYSGRKILPFIKNKRLNRLSSSYVSK